MTAESRRSGTPAGRGQSPEVSQTETPRRRPPSWMGRVDHQHHKPVTVTSPQHTGVTSRGGGCDTNRRGRGDMHEEKGME